MESRTGGFLLSAGYLEPVPIIEIGPRSIAGIRSRLFRCEAADGSGCYVKLGNASAEERLYVVNFGFLAKEMLS